MLSQIFLCFVALTAFGLYIVNANGIYPVKRFNFQESYKNGELQNQVVIETTFLEWQVLVFEVFKVENLHKDHLISNVTNCLFSGFRIMKKENEVNRSEPIKLKYCTDQEISGVLRVGADILVLQNIQDDQNPDDNFLALMHHSIFPVANARSSSFFQSKSKLGKGLDFDKIFGDKSWEKRAKREIRGRSFVEILVVNAYNYYEEVDSNQELIDRAIEFVHFADFFYAATDLNLHLVLSDVITFRYLLDDPAFVLLGNPSYTLDEFIEWHSENLDDLTNHDAAVYVTREDFNGVLGIAPVGLICKREGSAFIIMDNENSTVITGDILAHELGHLIGLNHNPDSPLHPCYCRGHDCVMDTYYVGSMDKFSTCQEEALKHILLNEAVMCLHNEPSSNMGQLGMCGDYIVQSGEGEECDCGPPDSCNDNCCNPDTCKLRSGASCSSMDMCCDSDLCVIKQAGELCRCVVNSCDLPEKCDGVSPQCPEDLFKRNSYECIEDGVQGHCHYGQCMANVLQCRDNFLKVDKLLYDWMTNDDCWALNRNGDESGDCGSSACLPVNDRCGRLQCYSKEGRVWSEDYDDYINTYTPFHMVEIGVEEYCYSLKADLEGSMHDVTEDGHYVRDGTSCNEDGKHFCYNKQCLHISQIATMTSCNNNCNGRGECDKTTNQCKCDCGYTGQSCDSSDAQTAQNCTEPYAGLITDSDLCVNFRNASLVKPQQPQDSNSIAAETDDEEAWYDDLSIVIPSGVAVILVVVVAFGVIVFAARSCT